MKKEIFLLLTVTLLLFGCSKQEESKKEVKTEKKVQIDIDKLKEEYLKLNTTEYIEKYIQKVIKNGLKGHGFLEEMPGNIVDEKTAKLISYYVVELTGRKSTHPKEAKTSQIFYTSNCGSCHGEDGKGIKNSAPDLTKKHYLGIEDRRKEIERLLKK